MRGFLCVASFAVVVLSALAAALCVPDLRTEGTTFAIAIGIMVLAGILWMLTEISCQIGELAKKTEAPNEGSARTAETVAR
jgi:galactitol-specific phosphotransferase system IIC component